MNQVPKVSCKFQRWRKSQLNKQDASGFIEFQGFQALRPNRSSVHRFRCQALSSDMIMLSDIASTQTTSSDVNDICIHFQSIKMKSQCAHRRRPFPEAGQREIFLPGRRDAPSSASQPCCHSFLLSRRVRFRSEITESINLIDAS